MDPQEDNKKEINMDVLKHLEDLSSQVNKLMAERTGTIFRRYPITFGLVILLGGIALHEGLKEIMKNYGLLDINPWYLIIFGLTLLSITGTLYKKLEK